MFGHLWVSMQLWSGLFMQNPHPQQKTNATYTKCRKHHPNFKKTHQKCHTNNKSLPRKSPNLTQPTYLPPPNLQLPVFLPQVTVLGSEMPFYTGNFTVDQFHTAHVHVGTRYLQNPPPKGDPGDPGRFFCGRDLVGLTKGKNFPKPLLDVYSSSLFLFFWQEKSS